MDIRETFDAVDRARWRRWLAEHHAREREIWLLLRRDRAGTITYLDAVEEAICFGWIDGIAKKFADAVAQRFTPRRPRSHWTELNKHRARRLIATGDMTAAGEATLPDLREDGVVLAQDIEARLRADPSTWRNYQRFPPLYQRVRISYIEEMRARDPAQWEKRLANFLAKTATGKMYGNWDDAGLPRTQRARAGEPKDEP